MDVTNRREKDWITRWLLEPDVMLEEGDPIAIGLREAYNDVPMPNLGLSKDEAAMLVDFLETEGRRVAKVEGNEVLNELKDKPAMECCQKDELGTIDESGKDSTDENEDPTSTAGDAGADQTPTDIKNSTFNFWLGSALAAAAMLLQLKKKKI
ncbi:MAG: hypothetical protein CMJ86_06790 [Planctomycetes bacterium]|jgi:hypothetical protein|nr:hypothetical protein [Planctomycetota bacterium]